MEKLGECIGRRAQGGLVIALFGDLGAGKTVLCKGIGAGLGIEDEVTSPTFTIVSEYEGRLRFHHIDAYRLAGPEDFAEIGGEELLADRGGLSAVEWSERIEDSLPGDAARVRIQVEADGSRLMQVEGAKLEDILEDCGNAGVEKEER